MQNKGLVKILGLALALISAFYLSFNLVTKRYENRAEAVSTIAKSNFEQSSAFANLTAKEKSYQLDSVGNNAYYNYLDSVGKEKVHIFGYTLKETRQKGVNLGLDLKGGMNVTLEISVPDILRALSNYNTTPNFNKALEMASEKQRRSTNAQYLDLFVQSYREIDPQAKLATIFSTFDLKDRITLSSTNDEVYNVLKDEIEGAINNSFNVLRTRIDRFGVIQPNIQKLENSGRILVELPGVKEPERVRKLLQGSANLEFWPTYELEEIINNVVEANTVIARLMETGMLGADEAELDEVDEETAEVEEAVVETTESEVAEAETEELSKADSLKAALASQTQTAADSLKQVEQFRKENPLFAVLSVNAQGGQVGRGPVVGMAESKDTALINSYFNLKQVKEIMPRDLGLRWGVNAVDENERYYELVAIKITSRDGRAPLTGSVITDARDQFGQHSSFAEVSMSMNAEGAKTWARLTKENIGKSVAIALDGYIYSYPTVNSEITGGHSSISGRFTPEVAKDLANVLKSGKMPAPARIVQEDVVGPSLGEEAIKSGMWAFAIAFVLVMLYMIFYYGLIPGIIADIALMVNVFFLLGILASFGAVLTLPGIAGIVLTLGMAVDGNVLIYERIREEMDAGKNLKRAVQDGFGNAISAIIDANVTTLLTGIVLYTFGQGPVQGFATTLIIGIVTSFITSVFLTRLMLETYANRENAKQVPFTTKISKDFLKNTAYKFIQKRKVWYIFSGSLIAIMILGFSLRGLNFGIDFSGGRNYVVQFDDQVDAEDVRRALSGSFGEDEATVISIGTNNDKLRISTKYKIADTSETADDEAVAELYNGLKPFLGDTDMQAFVGNNLVNSQKVGPTVADDIKVSSMWAIFFSLIIVALYIFIRFRDFGFSMGALSGLGHDVIIVVGVFALFWGILPFSMEVNQEFIAAILTIIGYSVNNTVVVFDRIREYRKLYPKRGVGEVMEDAINHTLSRSFSTSITVVIVLLAILLFGGDTIRGFIFALMVGTVFGAYSSIFISGPVAYEIITRGEKRKAKKLAASSARK